MIDVLNTGKWTPQQCLLEAVSQEDTMEMCVVVYMVKGEDCPRLTCSSMCPSDMNFLGFALQSYSLRSMKE